MSILGAMFSGVSGLNAQSQALGAIADNITNQNTIGYKATEVRFQTLVTSQASLNNYSPGGVQQRPFAAVDVQGLFASSTNANRAVGISSFFDSTDRTFFITGVQLEVGQNPTSFEHEPFEATLKKCQRYCKVYEDDDTTEPVSHGYWRTTTAVETITTLPTTLRSQPSITFVNATSITCLEPGVTFRASDSSPSVNERGTNSVKITYSTSTSHANHSTQGREGTQVKLTGDSAIIIDAEL